MQVEETCNYSGRKVHPSSQQFAQFELVGEDRFVCPGCGRTLKWSKCATAAEGIKMVPAHKPVVRKEVVVKAN